MTIDEVMRVVFDFGGQIRDSDSGGDEAAETIRAAIESYAGGAGVRAAGLQNALVEIQHRLDGVTRLGWEDVNSLGVLVTEALQAARADSDRGAP